MTPARNTRESEFSRNFRLRLTFVALIFSGFSFNAVGQIYPAEILLLLVALWPNADTELARWKAASRATALVFIGMFIAVFISTAMNVQLEFPYTLFAKEVANYFYFAFSFLGLTRTFLEFPEYRYRMLAVYGIGQVIGTLLLPSVYAEENPWKWGIGFGMLYIFAGAKLRARYRFFIGSLILIAAVFSLFMGARLLAILFFIQILTVLPLRAVSSSKRTWLLAATAGAAVFIYIRAAGAGLLGDDVKLKFDSQTSNSLGLLSGRSEWIFTVPAALRQPIVGYGVQASQSYELFLEGAARAQSLGLSMNSNVWNRFQTLPVHSALTSGWLTAGIFGLLLWLMILSLFALAFAVCIASHGRLYALLPLILLKIWDVLFSPFGGSARLSMALVLAFAVLLWQEASQIRAGLPNSFSTSTHHFSAANDASLRNIDAAQNHGSSTNPRAVSNADRGIVKSKFR